MNSDVRKRTEELMHLSNEDGTMTTQFSEFMEMLHNSILNCDWRTMFRNTYTALEFEEYLDVSLPVRTKLEKYAKEYGLSASGLSITPNFDRMREKPSNIFSSVKLQMYLISKPECELDVGVRTQMDIMETELFFICINGKFQLLPVFPEFKTVEVIS